MQLNIEHLVQKALHPLRWSLMVGVIVALPTIPLWASFYEGLTESHGRGVGIYMLHPFFFFGFPMMLFGGILIFVLLTMSIIRSLKVLHIIWASRDRKVLSSIIGILGIDILFILFVSG